MKVILLKAFVGLFGAFAAYYVFFLGSVLFELYGPEARWSGTAQAWALQGAGILFAPAALLGSVGLWHVSKRKDMVGTLFPRVSKVSLVILVFCALVNLLIFIPML